MRSVLRGGLLFGLPVSVLCMCGIAALLTAEDLPLRFYGIAAALPVLAGAASAGFAAGRKERHRGLLSGAAAALLLNLVWFAAALFSGGRLHLPLLFLTLPAGMLGGVCGVNTRLPLPLPRMHTASGFRERITVRNKTLHRPKQTVQPKQSEEI